MTGFGAQADLIFRKPRRNDDFLLSEWSKALGMKFGAKYYATVKNGEKERPARD
jgi:hypothetical protein